MIFGSAILLNNGCRFVAVDLQPPFTSAFEASSEIARTLAWSSCLLLIPVFASGPDMLRAPAEITEKRKTINEHPVGVRAANDLEQWPCQQAHFESAQEC